MTIDLLLTCDLAQFEFAFSSRLLVDPVEKALLSARCPCVEWSKRTQVNSFVEQMQSARLTRGCLFTSTQPEAGELLSIDFVTCSLLPFLPNYLPAYLSTSLSHTHKLATLHSWKSFNTIWHIKQSKPFKYMLLLLHRHSCQEGRKEYTLCLKIFKQTPIIYPIVQTLLVIICGKIPCLTWPFFNCYRLLCISQSARHLNQWVSIALVLFFAAIYFTHSRTLLHREGEKVIIISWSG